MSVCVICSKPLCRSNVSGYCKKHFGTTNGPRTSEQNSRQWNDPEFRIRRIGAIRRLHEQRIAWCPLEYREDYHFLKRVKHYSAAQARALIEARIEADLRRYLATGELQRTAA